MGRLRQQNASNYISSGNINAEFESIIRYLNAAELGNKTLSELLQSIFDGDGEFVGPIELQLDSTNGLQFRVGTYSDATAGWQTIVDIADIRGPGGIDIGTIGAPILYSRQDTTATAGQTIFSYAHEATDDLLVYDNGVLLTPSVDYTHDPLLDTVVFTVGRTAGHTITIYKIRATAVTGYRRVDVITAAPQAVFPFIHDVTTVLQVYKNGILQRYGGSYDYVSDPNTDTVTFTSTVAAGNTISIITVEDTAAQVVTGLMTEANYADTATGLIRLDRVALPDGGIAQVKVAGLVIDLAKAGKLIVSNTTPTGEWLETGRLWLDTSTNPNVLKFYDGSDWRSTSPDSSLPSFTPADAGKYVRINGSGTSYVYDTVDLSSVIPTNQKGVAGGVATLDSNGQLPVGQLPDNLSAGSFYHTHAGATDNGTYTIQRIYGQRIKLTGISLQCSAGTATIQMAVNGVAVGPTYALTTAGIDAVLVTPQQIDASTANKKIGFIVTSQAALADLEVTIAYSVLA